MTLFKNASDPSVITIFNNKKSTRIYNKNILKSVFNSSNHPHDRYKFRVGHGSYCESNGKMLLRTTTSRNQQQQHPVKVQKGHQVKRLSIVKVPKINVATIKKKRESITTSKRKRNDDDSTKTVDSDLLRFQNSSIKKTGEPPTHQIKQIKFGKHVIDTWFLSPYPAEYCNQSLLYICEFCFKYMRTSSIANRHKEKCFMKHPPGDEIYRQDKISIFEVDGRRNKMYCLNLCLLTKLFLDHKTLFYDVEPFLFYIMTETDQYGCHFVGYFSKEKVSFMNYNVSCILILPVHQRKGYGQYLIDFSYLLTKQEKTRGSPEKPLSNLGTQSYQKYWKYTVFKHFLSMMAKRSSTTMKISIEDISLETSMTPDDIISTLQRDNMISFQGNQYVLNINEQEIQQQVEKMESKQHLKVDPTKLVWKPFQLPQLSFSHEDDYDDTDDDEFSVSTN